MGVVEIVFYTTSTKRQPFVDWRNDLDAKTNMVIAARLARIRAGHFGDCKRIAGCHGLWELRIDYGPGYRIYFGKQGQSIVVVLVGGSKVSQKRDIAKAARCWFEYLEPYET